MKGKQIICCLLCGLLCLSCLAGIPARAQTVEGNGGEVTDEMENSGEDNGEETTDEGEGTEDEEDMITIFA